MRYSNDEEVLHLVKLFEEAAISREEWRHAEHMVVALYYCANHDVDNAIEFMRKGILKLLAAFGVDLTKEMPYHETMTVFWVRAVADFERANEQLSLHEKANQLAAEYDKDYPLRFYSRELLFSDNARANFVEPDLIGKAEGFSVDRKLAEAVSG